MFVACMNSAPTTSLSVWHILATGRASGSSAGGLKIASRYVSAVRSVVSHMSLPPGPTRYLQSRVHMNSWSWSSFPYAPVNWVGKPADAAPRTWTQGQGPGVPRSRRGLGSIAPPGLQPHSPAMGQKDGEKWTAAVDSQPTLPKPDRLLAVERGRRCIMVFVLMTSMILKLSIVIKLRGQARSLTCPAEVPWSDAVMSGGAVFCCVRAAICGSRSGFV